MNITPHWTYEDWVSEKIRTATGPWLSFEMLGNMPVPVHLLNVLEKEEYEVREIITSGDGWQVLARLREELPASVFGNPFAPGSPFGYGLGDPTTQSFGESHDEET